MDDTVLFTAALQLDDPWKVAKVKLLGDDAGSKPTELHITLMEGYAYA